MPFSKAVSMVTTALAGSSPGTKPTNRRRQTTGSFSNPRRRHLSKTEGLLDFASFKYLLIYSFCLESASKCVWSEYIYDWLSSTVTQLTNKSPLALVRYRHSPLPLELPSSSPNYPSTTLPPHLSSHLPNTYLLPFLHNLLLLSS